MLGAVSIQASYRPTASPSLSRASRAYAQFFAIEFARWAGDVALARQAPNDRAATRDHGCVVVLIHAGSFALAGVAGVDEIMHRCAPGAIKPVLYGGDGYRDFPRRDGLATDQAHE